MAERERFAFDFRALRHGVVNGALSGALAFAFVYAVTRIVGPAVRDLGWHGAAPGAAASGVVAAVVGLVIGSAKMRASRRVVVAGYSGAGRPGARALELARLSAARPDSRAARGAEVSRSVRRWSPDLLHGGGSDEVEEVIVYGSEPRPDSEVDAAGGALGVDAGSRDRVPSEST